MTGRSSGASAEYSVGRLADFPPGSRRIVQVGEREVGIFNISGTLYALPNICPHQTGPVCSGARLTGSLRSSAATAWQPEWVCDGEIIVCPWHGLEYHVPTGQCLAFPQIKLRRYPVLVDGDVVKVRLGGPMKASTA
jgi:nitrite reductase (NADH) small subunit